MCQQQILADVRFIETIHISHVLWCKQLVWMGNVTIHAIWKISIWIVSSVLIDGSVGYLLEVDLEYPTEIYDSHADLSFCLIREQSMDSKQIKLFATLENKERYVIHYRYLQQCLRYGLRLRKIHPILEFKQSRWLRDYIELNIGFRTRATSDFHKSLYKWITRYLGKR